MEANYLYLDQDYGIRIDSPKEGEDVGGEFAKLTGTYMIQPPSGTLRLFTTDAQTSELGERYWPQTIVDHFDAATKTWTATIHIGDISPTKRWIIAAVVGSSSVVLWNYYYKVGPKADWPAFDGWPTDAKVCHRMWVSRLT